MNDGIIEIEKEAGSENAFVQRGCATVVNDKMMYFGGSIDPIQVCNFSYIIHVILDYLYNLIYII